MRKWLFIQTGAGQHIAADLISDMLISSSQIGKRRTSNIELKNTIIGIEFLIFQCYYYELSSLISPGMHPIWIK